MNTTRTVTCTRPPLAAGLLSTRHIVQHVYQPPLAPEHQSTKNGLVKRRFQGFWEGRRLDRYAVGCWELKVLFEMIKVPWGVQDLNVLLAIRFCSEQDSLVLRLWILVRHGGGMSSRRSAT